LICSSINDLDLNTTYAGQTAVAASVILLNARLLNPKCKIIPVNVTGTSRSSHCATYSSTKLSNCSGDLIDLGRPLGM